MPVDKFRHVGDMERANWLPPGDPRLFRAIRATWTLADRIARPHFPPGVYKHRTAASADALRAEWEQANFEAFHARRAQHAAGDATR
ncbi:MAG: hypothetical protein IT182_17740 [Acidobacteria bacterium]|nr:hypothetical protein [Acidobacteriota bacterium]